MKQQALQAPTVVAPPFPARLAEKLGQQGVGVWQGTMSPRRLPSAVIRGGNTAVNDGTVIEAHFADPTLTTPMNRPAIAIQSARDVRIEALKVRGENTNPLDPSVLSDAAGIAAPDVSDWVCDGCSANQYSPNDPGGSSIAGFPRWSGAVGADSFSTEFKWPSRQLAVRASAG